MKSRCNWKCRIGWHHWVVWSEVDRDVGFIFSYIKCDRPRCKWSGLTWVDRERLPDEMLSNREGV
jgi:hypothetical protein